MQQIQKTIKLNKELINNFSLTVKDSNRWPTKNTFDKAFLQLIKDIEPEFTDNLVRVWNSELDKQGEIGTIIFIEAHNDFEINYDFFNIDELVEEWEYAQSEEDKVAFNNYIEFFGLTDGHIIPFIISGFRNAYFFTYNIKLECYNFIGVNIV